MARNSGLKSACFNNLGAAVSLNSIAPEWVRQVTKPVQTGFTAQCGATSVLRPFDSRQSGRRSTLRRYILRYLLKRHHGAQL